MMNTNLLAVLSPPSIYRVSFTRKTFWRKVFTLGEFTPAKMKNCGRRNVSKHRDIKNGEKYTTLDILLKFGSMDKMEITNPDPKYYLGRSGKGLITYVGLKIIVMPKKNKKSSYAITNVSMKDLSKIIKEFEKFPYTYCVRKRPNHEPTDS